MNNTTQNKIGAERFVAHRGYANAYPENTLLALEQAIAVGARYIELDVQLSRDAQAMIFHDPNLERMCGHDQPLVALTAEQLTQFSAHYPAKFGKRFSAVKISPLTALVPLLQAHPEVNCCVEVKAENRQYFAIDGILAALRSALAPVLEQCILISFDHELIANAHHQGFKRLGWVLESWDQVESARQVDYLETVFCNVNYLDEGANLSAFPWRWAVYEIDQVEHAQALFDLGVEQIETFAIEEMLTAFNARNEKL